MNHTIKLSDPITVLMKGKTLFPILYTKWIMMSVLSQPLIVLTGRKTFLLMLYTKWVMVIMKTW